MISDTTPSTSILVLDGASGIASCGADGAALNGPGLLRGIMEGTSVTISGATLDLSILASDAAKELILMPHFVM
jgi:hypothetical protein